jgi:phosphate transport system substrate-binding protein
VFSFSSYALTLNGAGATFPYPIYSKWISEYKKVNSEVRINYQSIGSGGGVRQLLNQTVDFGASDAPMSDKNLSKSKANGWPLMHVPTILGAVVISYNVEEIKDNLKLDGELIGKIFLGEVTKWNDPAIQELNPGMELPDKDLLVVRRADGSGTTAVFSEYLSKVSEKWKNKVGSGKSLRWPTGIGARGNEGVTAMVKQTDGTIGYVELAYALQQNLSTAMVKNKAGEFMKPTVDAISKAAAGKKEYGEDLRMSVANAEGKGVYPISAFTYILLPMKEQDDKLEATKNFLVWALTEGQKMAKELHYAPLPDKLAKTIIERLK